MVDLDYNQTVCSFKYGVKNPKYIYVILLATIGIIFLISCGVLAIYILSNDSAAINDIASIIFACIVFGLLLIGIVCILLYELLYVKKGILKCIKAPDAQIISTIPFEFSSAYGGLFKNIYKLGVKFKYNNEIVTMTCRKYAYIKKYIGIRVDIVYSPSCDDIVILK